MNYLFLANGVEELQAVAEQANITFSGGSPTTFWGSTTKEVCYVTTNERGVKQDWSYDGDVPNTSVMEDISKCYPDHKLVLASQVLNEQIEFPWNRKVNKDNPPQGYRLLTDEERKITYRKGDSALYWDDTKWDTVVVGEPTENWSSKSLYAIPVDCELQVIEQVKIKIGDKFKLNSNGVFKGNTYMITLGIGGVELSSVDNPDFGSGTWCDGIESVSDLLDLTKDEIDQIFGGDYHKFEYIG